MVTHGPQGSCFLGSSYPRSWVSMHLSAWIGQMWCCSLDKSMLRIASLRVFQTSLFWNPHRWLLHSMMLALRGYISYLCQTKRVSIHLVLVAINANLWLVDLLASKIPVIHGAPPLCDSDSLRGKRVFFNSKVDYEGPAWLPNTAKAWIRKHIGGRKPPTLKMDLDSDIEDLFDMSPSPAPMWLRSTKQKGVRAFVADVAKGTDLPPPVRLPKATLRWKRVEVIITKKGGNAATGGSSVITIQDSSNSNAGKIICDSSDANLLEEQAPRTYKCKADCQDSSCAMKRAGKKRKNRFYVWGLMHVKTRFVGGLCYLR